MRKIRFLFVLIYLCMFSNLLLAQVTEKFNYQAVLRNSTGELVKNQDVTIQVSILESSTTGTVVYREQHSTTTNNFGMVELLIGSGTSDIGTFAAINWGTSEKFLKVEVNTGSGLIEMGTTQLLSVPYALYAKDVANKDDADADPLNEIQNLVLIGTDLSVSGGNTIDLSIIQDGVDDADNDPANEIQNINLVGTDLSISAGNTIDLSIIQDGVDDADNDPANEIQNLSLVGTDLSISDGNTIDLSIIQDGVDDADNDPANEIQDLNLTSNILTITNKTSPTEINLAAYTGTNTDEQVLSLSGTDLSISGGNTVDLSPIQDGVDDADNNPLNEIQNLTLVGDTLEISNGNSIVFPYDSSRWAINGDKLYYNTGNVGVGTLNPVSKLDVKSTATSGALFQVINANNDTVFAVYPDGVKVFVNETTKGKVGGFAVSGRSPTKAGVEVEYLRVTPDSTRIYVNDSVSTKGKVGGFAVSGRSPTKGLVNDYLHVTKDSTRVYITESIAKGKVGGFAVSGRSPGKGLINEYIQITKDSTRIYISESQTKGKVGGFAVSGRSPTKAGEMSDYFNISGNTIAEKILNESRVMWYPEKSALLAGELQVETSDDVGENSISLGYRCKAKGNWSQAFGYESVTTGTYATAIGWQAEADTNSFAFGYQAQALGNDAIALGSGALAIANKSFAFGSVGIDSLGNVTGSTKATGEYAYAIGLGAVASGRGSFAIGANDTASGDFATAIGYKTKASNYYSTAIGGYSEATADYATAFGLRNKSTGIASTTMGRFCEASGTNSFASGVYSKAGGSNATAFGYGSQANGSSSIAIGYFNTASASGSVAFGYSNTAGAAYSVVFGQSCTTTATHSFAAGYSSDAKNKYAFAYGRDALASGENSIAFGYLNRATGYNSAATGYNTRASGMNSFAAGYETKSKAYASFVVGRWNDSTGTTGSWDSAEPLFVAGNGAASTSTSNALTLFKNGNMTIAGNLTAPSDIRLKTNIQNIDNVILLINKIKPIYFEFINQETHPSGRQIGFIAQEIQPLFPELVSTDSKGFLSVDYSRISVILLKAIQEQQQIIDDQALKNKELENQINEINKKLDLLLKNSK